MTTDRDIEVLTESANPEPSSTDANATATETDADVAHVFHYSEDGTIRRFAPHVPQSNPGHPASVWAIDAEHSPLYWFPRFCPRISVWARDAAEQATFTALFDSEAPRIVAAETDWMDRVRDGELYRYVFDARAFKPWEKPTVSTSPSRSSTPSESNCSRTCSRCMRRPQSRCGSRQGSAR